MSYAEQLRVLEEKTPEDNEERAFAKLLGYNIARARERRGFLQKTLADVLGVSQSMLSRYECGEGALTVYDLTRVAAALDTRLAALLPREG